MKRYPFNKLSKAATNLQAFRGTFLLQLLHKHTHTKQLNSALPSSWLFLEDNRKVLLFKCRRCCVSLSLKSEKSEIQQANCEIYLATLVLSQYRGRDRIFGLCAGLCSCAHTLAIIVPRRKKKTQKHSSTILQEQNRSKCWYTQTSNWKCSASSLLFHACLQLHQFWMPVLES